MQAVAAALRDGFQRGILTPGQGREVGGLIPGWLMCSHHVLPSPLTPPQQSSGALTLLMSPVTTGTELLLRRCSSRFDPDRSQSPAQARAVWWLLGPCVDTAAQEWRDSQEPWERLRVITTPPQSCQTSSQCQQQWGKKLRENSRAHCRGLQRHCCSP